MKTTVTLNVQELEVAVKECLGKRGHKVLGNVQLTAETARDAHDRMMGGATVTGAVSDVVPDSE